DLALLGLLALGDVDRHAADAHDVIGGIDAGDRGANAPAGLAVRAAHPEFGLEGRARLSGRLHRILQMLPVLRVDQLLDVLNGDLEARGVAPENPVLPVVPHEGAADRIKLPGAHLAGGQRQAAALLALHQPGARSLQLAGSLGNTALELAVELLELS